MSGDQLDLDQLLYDAEQGWALSTEARMALAAEVRLLRAKVERVEAAVSDNGPRTMMLADDVRAALDGA